MNRSNTKPQEFKFSETRKNNKMGSTMVNNFIMSSSVDNTITNN